MISSLLSIASLFLVKTFTFYKLNKNKTIKESFIDSGIFVPKILLQQILLFYFWYFCLKDYFSKEIQILILATAFTMLHFYLLFTLKKIDALIIIVSSLFGGIIFTNLYTLSFFGFITAFCIHIIFHILLDCIFIILKLQPIKIRKDKDCDKKQIHNN